MGKYRNLRIAIASVAIAIIFFCTQFHVVSGSLCVLCPVGFAEIGLASGEFPWRLLPGVLALLAVVFLVGRAFCSWLCPTSLVRNLLGGETPLGLTGRVGTAPKADAAGFRTRNNIFAQGLVLVVLLAVSLIVHFPVFCLVCPIGLAMGFIFAASRTFVTWQLEWDLVVFPAMLLVEALLLRRWCSAICPIGFFFGLVARARVALKVPFAPRVFKSACIAEEGCRSCQTACPESIPVPNATPRDLSDCTACLNCLERCPARAVTLVPTKEDN